MRCLLDKNVIRYAIAGLRYGRMRLLSPLEAGALSYWRAAEARGDSLFISHASFGVLQQLSRYDEVQILLDSVGVLRPTRYHARWARRIRETTGLAREDAALIALASFSSDAQGSILGVHWFITSDHPLVNGYREHLPALSRRLHAMAVQLPQPFREARLPRLAMPDDLLAEWDR